ncbi:MAG: MTAP family purine nucleoside phosphorylase [Deltaproteobacteria bacterium]|nr:MTAP family purine nucleoside phosphorylase [Deltaproteobacteria bacterium]
MTAKVAVIGGSGVLALELFQGLKEVMSRTARGEVLTARGENLLFLQRHGRPPRPPHKINHHANLLALQDWGADYVIAINSTGSLDPALRPGSLLVPDDYFNPWGIQTFFDEKMEFTTPGLSAKVRQALLAAAGRLGAAVTDGGTYVQTSGPRFETRAEIRVLAAWGEVVGMTLAHEATLARELGLEYASLCLVDNYANGIREQTVAFREIEQAQAENGRILSQLLPVAISCLVNPKEDL